MMLGTLARRIYDRQVSMIARGARTPRVTGPIWDAARKEAAKILGDRHDDRAWRTKFVEVVERRSEVSQPKYRRRDWHWKHGPGRKSVRPKKRR